MTLEDLLYKIGETAIKNKIINFSAVGGDVYDLNVENIKDYPVLFASPTGTHQVRENTTEYEVTFYFLDRLLSDDVNDVQIFSTAIEQLKLILTMVENIKGVLDVTDDYDIQNFTETERMNDRVAGAFATVKIMIQNMSGCCDTEFVTLMLKLENKTLNVTKNGKYTVTYNKMYDGLRKVEVDVNVDVETPYQDGFADGKEEGLEQGYVSGKQDGIAEGYESGKEDGLTEGYAEGKADGIAEGAEVGKELAAQDAIVLNVTENGSYYTKYADIPEWTETETGDDFYSYARLGQNMYFNTEYSGVRESIVEFWFKYDDKSFSGTYATLVGKQGPNGTNIMKIRVDSYLTSTFSFECSGKATRSFTMTKDVWHKIKFSHEGVWVDNERVVTAEGKAPNAGSTPFCINGTEGWAYGANGYYGMVKIDDNIYIPTKDGYINKTMDIPLPVFGYNPDYYDFTKIEKPVPFDELIKEVNVQTKINIEKGGIKLSNSTFSNIPSYFDFTGVSSLTNMFENCFKLGDLSPLENVDVSGVKYMGYCFYQIGTNVSTLNYLPLANWDTSNVVNMDSMFGRNHTDSLAGLENWDTSKVAIMSSMFEYNSNITDIDALANWDTSKVTDMSNMFENCYALKNVDAITNWDTSNVVNMDSMFSNTSIRSFPAIDCSKIEYNKYPLYNASVDETLTDVGGFINAKSRWNNNYGLAKFAGLTRESCINILNGLYDFTAAGETADTYQGKLKVHANFLTAVGDDISIGINKGWQITA